MDKKEEKKVDDLINGALLELTPEQLSNLLAVVTTMKNFFTSLNYPPTSKKPDVDTSGLT